MTSYRRAAVAALLLLNTSTNAFVRPSIHSSQVMAKAATTTTQRGMFDFLKQGKQALVKTLAGDYDEEVAKEVLDAKNAKYTVVECDKDNDGKALRAELGELVGRTSVPAIWIGGDFVGGCNDGPMGGLVKLNDEGKLDGMLQAVGAV